jgi:integrase/recombinase XerD
MTTLVQKVSKGELETRKLTDSKYLGLSQVPPETEWFANILNANTRRAYRNDVTEFMAFIGITRPEEFRTVTRAHIIAWRDDVVQREYVQQKESTSPLFDGLEPEVEVKKTSAATVRRKLSALSSLFDYLCERNAVTHNPVKGVQRPNEGSGEGKTPALSDAQARHLLVAPENETLKGKRDRAMIAV